MLVFRAAERCDLLLCRKPTQGDKSNEGTNDDPGKRQWGRDRGGNTGGNETWSDPRSIWKVKSPGLPDGVHGGGGGMRERGDPKRTLGF